MEINKKSSVLSWKLALIGASTSIGIVVFGLGGWYLSTTVLGEVSSSSNGNKHNDGLFLVGGSNGKNAYIDKNGKIVLDPQFELSYEFQDGLARIRINDSFGYMDKEGRVAISPQFDAVTNFKEGVAFVKIGSKWAVINKEGKVVINPQFDDTSYFFSQELAGVKIGEKWGYIDKKGSIVIQPIFYDVLPFANNLAPFKLKKDSEWGYIDRTGTIVIEPKFNRAYNFSEGLALVRVGNKFGYIDKKGSTIIPLRFSGTEDKDEDYLEGGGAFSAGLAAVIEGGEYHNFGKGKKFYIDKTGKAVISFQMDDHSKFSEELAFVKIGDKCGYIDKVGKIVINPQFKSCSSFSEGLASVISTNDRKGYIDTSGKYVWQESE